MEVRVQRTILIEAQETGIINKWRGNQECAVRVLPCLFRNEWQQSGRRGRKSGINLPVGLEANQDREVAIPYPYPRNDNATIRLDQQCSWVVKSIGRQSRVVGRRETFIQVAVR